MSPGSELPLDPSNKMHTPVLLWPGTIASSYKSKQVSLQEEHLEAYT
jgi:hypothetical protein